jgi:hypothetical protein
MFSALTVAWPVNSSSSSRCYTCLSSSSELAAAAQPAARLALALLGASNGRVAYFRPGMLVAETLCTLLLNEVNGMLNLADGPSMEDAGALQQVHPAAQQLLQSHELLRLLAAALALHTELLQRYMHRGPGLLCSNCSSSSNRTRTHSSVSSSSAAAAAAGGGPSSAAAALLQAVGHAAGHAVQSSCTHPVCRFSR